MKQSPFLNRRHWRGATPINERRGRDDLSAPSKRGRIRSYYRSDSSNYSCGSSSRRSSQAENSGYRDPNSIKPEEVICHGMQVTNVDNYIANLFR